jgi:hypothetical protein
VPSTRVLVALFGGALAYLATLHRFLTYAERSRLTFENHLTFAGLALVIGLVASLGLATGRYRIAKFVVFGAWAAHAVAVWVDLRNDPTADHNLLPFEFIILGVEGATAYIGAAIAHVVGALTGRPR